MHTKNEILLVAPYQDMYLHAQNIIQENSWPIELVQGSMETIEDVYNAVEALNPSIVVSRGGTYLLLKKKFPNLIFVEIKISAYDILRACLDAKKAPGDIAFLGFSNIIWGLDVIGTMLGKKIYAINFQKREYRENVSQYIEELAGRGVGYFVCDSISHHVATQLGFSSHLVSSEPSTLKQFMEDALHLLEVKIKEQMNTRRYRLIVDSVDDGIISLDKYQDQPIMNRSAEYFCTKNQLDHGQLIELIESGGNDHGGKTEIKTLHQNCTIAIQRFPIDIDENTLGVVAKFQDVTKIQKLEEKIRTELSQKGLIAKYTFDDILYDSQIMKRTVKTAQKFALSESTVLIQAETGTGKELFAQSIHNASSRKNRPFVAINCAALPENLLESELFGYAEGAFTGAKKGGKMGLIELAHTGTLFLDEIGDMPLALQTRLLRVIQEREVMRIGDTLIRPIDIRIIAATNMDLGSRVATGDFRSDLYYRLHILTLRIPTLDERPEDLVILADKFIKDAAYTMKKQIIGFTPDAFRLLINHRFKGNVRELQGIIERSSVLTDGPYITKEDLDLEPEHDSGQKTSPATLDELEKDLLEKTLKDCNYNYVKAAKLLGISRSTLYRKTKNAL
ncbi:sigma 54-interacting transcriptional regulator [Clostridium sp. AM58-1XD]|uniref:sigma 54-interacting transcriptional regulator n=1 Tax=Clostridium sp. AM58-1XD TaxID=2292307 RepID=UPI000E4A45AD|nr:sigma 54-interacting transcriptional regulator [Clostridium sp. AM58-1XD]RGY98373.1 sigma-54-dependent Fis family transcriptional regulator [Clostridium sp. AM58-1XD]